MNKKAVIKILTVSALIASIPLLVMSIYGIVLFFSRLRFQDIYILISMVFGILGFVGLIMNLFDHKHWKIEMLNFIFLFLGIIGFILFVSLEGGSRAWKWIIYMEEPDEWFVVVYPLLITFVLLLIKAKRLITLTKKPT